jgi:hypothetical protein
MFSRRQLASNTRLKKGSATRRQSGSCVQAGLFDKARQERFMLRDFSKTLRELWRISNPGAGAYRPDLHYMRGPGPKWRAKYGNLYPKTSSASAPTGPELRDLTERHV